MATEFSNLSVVESVTDEDRFIIQRTSDGDPNRVTISTVLAHFHSGGDNNSSPDVTITTVFRSVLSEQDLNNIQTEAPNSIFFAIIGEDFGFRRAGQIYVYTDDWELFSNNGRVTGNDYVSSINDASTTLKIDSSKVDILSEVLRHEVVGSASALAAITPASNVLYFIVISADFTANSVNYKAGETYIYSHSDSTWVRLSGVVNSNVLTVNLSYTASPTKGTIVNSAGGDVDIPVVDVTNSGLMLPSDKARLDGLAVDLSTAVSPTGIIINNSFGSNATIPIATAAESGLLSPALFNKLTLNHVVSILPNNADLSTYVTCLLYTSPSPRD